MKVKETLQTRKEHEMIYCAYSGCGKTTYCKAHPTTSIDLDSSLFDKREGWEEEYVRVALTLSANYNVFISAHRKVIEVLNTQNILFKVIIPDENKDTWRARLLFRVSQNPTIGNQNALKDFDCNYDNDMEYYTKEMPNTIELLRVHAKINTDIETILTPIE